MCAFYRLDEHPPEEDKLQRQIEEAKTAEEREGLIEEIASIIHPNYCLNRYRLQKDGSWREIKKPNESIESEDTAISAEDVPIYNTDSVNVNGEEYIIDNTGTVLRPVLHRDKKSEILPEENLEKVVDDWITIDIDGKFTPFDPKTRLNPKFANFFDVRYENPYVNEESTGGFDPYTAVYVNSEDSDSSILAAWCHHLSTGLLGLFACNFSPKDAADEFLKSMM